MVVVGVEQGIVLAMVMSLLRIVRHSYQPHTAVLVKGDGEIWRLTPVVPGAVSEPGLVIYRFGAPLFYANAGRFSDEIRNLVGTDPTSLVRWVLVDAGAITNVDYSAARVIQELQAELSSRKVELVFAHVEDELDTGIDGANYDVSPDGKRFLMLKPAPGTQARLNQLHVVVNWCEELRRRVPAQTSE